LARSSIDEVAASRDVYRKQYAQLLGGHTGVTVPGKVKALRREGPKRGAKELSRIIETATSRVNTKTIRKYPAPTVD
jgi:gamma-glutamyltranspeptidase